MAKWWPSTTSGTARPRPCWWANFTRSRRKNPSESCCGAWSVSTQRRCRLGEVLLHRRVDQLADLAVGGGGLLFQLLARYFHFQADCLHRLAGRFHFAGDDFHWWLPSMRWCCACSTWLCRCICTANHWWRVASACISKESWRRLPSSALSIFAASASCCQPSASCWPASTFRWRAFQASVRTAAACVPSACPRFRPCAGAAASAFPACASSLPGPWCIPTLVRRGPARPRCASRTPCHRDGTR